MTKECPICAQRQKLIDKLDEIQKKENEFEREKKRTALITLHGKIIEPGFVNELNECPDCKEKRRIKQNIVSSTSTAYDFGKHIHKCSLCGKQFPEKGSYDGDFVDDSLESNKK